MSERQIGIGIIGLGPRGFYFGAGDFSKNGFKVVAVCDTNEKKCKTAQEAFGQDVAIYADYNELLMNDAVEAVVIASPDYTHAEIAIAVLKAKKHLYLEKPMAQTIEDCDKIIKAWKGSNVVFMVGLELRYCTLFREMKRIISSGEIGQIQIGTVIDNVSVGGDYFFHNKYRYQNYVKTLVLQKGTHSIDLCNWMVDSTPKRVYSSASLDVLGGKESPDKRCSNCEKGASCPYYMSKDGIKMDYGQVINDPLDMCVYGSDCDVSDNSLVTIDYENGARITYMECHFTPEYTREFMFVGDKGKIEGHFDNDQNFKIKLWKRFEKEPTYIYPEKSDGGHGGGDRGIVQEFRRLVLEGKPIMKGVKGARDSAAIAIASYESEKSGLAVTIPDVSYPPEAVN